VKWHRGWVFAASMLVACTSVPHRPAAQHPGVKPTGASVESLVAAVLEDSQRSEHEADAKVREQLASDANRDGDACLALEPDAAACLYGHAVALGLQARAHPARALGLLNDMLAALTRAEAVDPDYDQAGPARVRALVLIRAPGWPLGPGDVEEGLAAARRAAARRPEYPANLLALAEALAKNGDQAGAHDYFARARDAAESSPAGLDRESWLRQANEGLQQHR
jgi:hypothetical protein